MSFSKGNGVFNGLQPPRTITGLTEESLREFARVTAYREVENTYYDAEFHLEPPEPSHLYESSSIRYDRIDSKVNKIEVGMTPPTESATTLTVSAPASSWTVGQTVDDHNLLTILGLNTSNKEQNITLTQYGAPARLYNNGIKIESGDRHSTLLNRKYLD